MYDEKWDTFAATGKISDYLSFKGIPYFNTTNNGDLNADADGNADTQGTCNTGISCG